MNYKLLRDCIEHKAGTVFRPTKEGRYIADRNADGFELGYAAHWIEFNSELFEPIIDHKFDISGLRQAFYAARFTNRGQFIYDTFESCWNLFLEDKLT